MYTLFKKKIFTFGITVTIVFVMVLAPVSGRSLTVQNAEAQLFGGGRIVFDPTNFAKNAISSVMDATTAGGISYLVFKEKVLDPLSYRLINSIISGMLKSLTRWVNSGFQGSPAFVTDLEGFLRNALDEAAGEFLADSGLDFLCSPFKLDVKIALNIQYAESRSAFGSEGAQCTLSDISNNVESFLNGTFSDGGWGSWFELTQGPYNDPNKALLESRARMSAVLRNAKGREFELLAGNDFFLNVEVCEEGTSANGSIKNCSISTLGTIIEHQLNDQFDGSRRRLELADEFDELVGALLAQVANQAITGLGGLLGLGGSSYSNNIYGSDGRKSYLDALTEEAEAQTSGGAGERIQEAINRQITYSSLQSEIMDLVDDVEAKITAAEQAFPGCFRVRMTSELTDVRDQADLDQQRSDIVITILNDFKVLYQNAQTTQQRLTLIEQFAELEADGLIATELDLSQAELDIDLILPGKIGQLEDEINAEVNRCQTRLSS